MNTVLKNNKKMKWLQIVVLTLFVPLIHFCEESEETARKKLDVICKDDLTAIIDSIPAEDLIEKPYYKLVLYKNYSEGSYSKKAVAEFYFLKNVSVKVVRKYRYFRSVKMWDRYSNEYVFTHDSSSVKP